MATSATPRPLDTALRAMAKRGEVSLSRALSSPMPPRLLVPREEASARSWLCVSLCRLSTACGRERCGLRDDDDDDVDDVDDEDA